MNHNNLKSLFARRVAIPVVALLAAVSVGAWFWSRPADAASAPAPPAAAMDAGSVAPLLAYDQAMAALTARVRPAVVNINVTSRQSPDQITGDGEPDGQQQQQQLQPFFGPGSPFGQFFQGPPRQQGPQVEKDLGSGVIISPDGYIITNNHVVNGAISISVTLSNRDIYPARLIGADPLTDLAVVKIDAHNLPSIPWGNTADLQVGQMVLAVGNPYGFRFSVTNGIISALNRPNLEANRRKPGEFIQTNAAINPGNSGGALVDARGQLIGINQSIYSPTGAFAGMGFAIPTEIAQPIADELIRDGKVEHGYMGITISDVTPDNARFFDLKKAMGAVVTNVAPDLPGNKAGIKTGDVITAIDGKPVSDSGQLQMETVLKQPGQTIHLDISRNGQTLNIPVTLASGSGSDETEVAQDSNGKGRWGMGLADLTPDVRQQLQAPDDVHGAVIESVRSGSPADNAGISQGDVVVSVNRKPTPTAADVVQALSGIPSGQDVLVGVWSNGGDTFLVLHSNAG